MPRISEFFGLIVYMYWKDTKKHKLPHFHVRYTGLEIVYDLQGNRLAGRQSKADKLIKEWCEERQDELEYAWSCAVEGKEVPWIAPLQ